jgi:DNA helicase-2/ATP-dependent DNA helicase PcrA
MCLLSPGVIDDGILVGARRCRRKEVGRYGGARMTVPEPPGQLRLLDDLPPPAERRRVPLAVTGLVTYARCPRQCYWDVVERRPRPLRPAARIGSLVHGWIEREAAGQASLLEGSPEPDPWIAELQAAFLASPWARRRPRAVERPFVLAVSGATVRGRVDAVYDVGGPGAVRREIVDFKTGRRPASDDGGAGLQLGLYALAAVDCWGWEPESLRTTEWYVREAAGVTRDWDAAAVAGVRDRLALVLADVAAGRFGPTPGSYCGRCAHVTACPEGQAVTGEGR